MSRLATDEEVATWTERGWVLLEGLIDTDTIDAAAAELPRIFPTREDYFADPAGTRRKWLGEPPETKGGYVWPETGPGFRPEQHTWRAVFPVRARTINRLFVHPSLTDFAQRALQAEDVRLYQARLSAKFSGETNYEQPMHTDRNHSWLPPRPVAPWWHVESFLYLCDVDSGNAPTHVVPVDKSKDWSTSVPLIMPGSEPDIYAHEEAAAGVRGSLLAYRPDVFHRGVDLTEPGAARYFLNVSFKVAGCDWIGYDTQQSVSQMPDWTRFVEASTPSELALFGWPEPGHPIWTSEFLDETAERYPKLDLTPWRQKL